MPDTTTAPETDVETTPDETLTSDSPKPTDSATDDVPEAVKNVLAKERKTAREAEKRAKALEAELQELRDRDKSEAEKLAEQASRDAKRAEEAEAKLTRYEVAADKGLDPKLADLLTGSREEMEAKADLLLEHAKPKVDPETYDAGVRTTSTDPAGMTPEEEHRQTLKQLFGQA